MLLDLPFFDSETRQAFLDPAAQRPGFTPALDSLAPAWERGITKRIDSQPMARAFEMFVEQLRHGEAMHAAFAAARDYDAQGAAAALTEPLTVIATQSPLLEPSRAGAAALARATLIERTGHHARRARRSGPKRSRRRYSRRSAEPYSSGSTIAGGSAKGRMPKCG